MDEIERYYLAQAGSGLAGFSGIRYQRGHGFFGRLLSGSVFPLLKFLGKNLLKTGVNVASDLLDTDDFSLRNIKETAADNAKKQAKDMLSTAVKKMSGSGKRKWVDPLSLENLYSGRVKRKRRRRKKANRKIIKKRKLSRRRQKFIKGGKKRSHRRRKKKPEEEKDLQKI